MNKFVCLLRPLVLGAVILSFLVACSGAGDKEPVSMEFWTRQTQDDRMAVINLLVETYNTLNTDQVVKAVPVEENDMALQIRTSASAGTLPGVAEIDAEIAIAMGSEGLVDTAVHQEIIEGIGNDSFYAGALKLFQNSENEYSGIPFNGMIQAIWYRSDWFAEAGLEPPSTWDNILKAAEYFTDPEANQYGILVGTMETESYDEQCFTPIAMSNNALMLDDNGNVVFNSPAMREALTFYAELARYNPPGPQTWRGRDYYLQGKMAMFFYSTFIMDDLALENVAEGSLTNENFEDLSGAAFDPELVKATQAQSVIGNKTESSFGAITGLSILNADDEAKRESSKQFVQYLFEKDNYITYLHMSPGGMLPTIKSVSSDSDFLNDPKGVYQRYGTDKIIALNEGFDDLKSFGIVNGKRFELASVVYSKKIIPQMIYKVTQEGMDIDEALAWAQGEIEKLQ
ncbi:extracellular solute-binding protein [Candidatus Haliotispira prima]|uniref:Extracellular solute-binding protein n=1 Tax=Candidatus Haliotispira prima TaxID=3034016 RepID=A0ABY8MF17_9SPIO|nr:extracellular solute-binding protein [Candidatus Haliotispira prima]